MSGHQFSARSCAYSAMSFLASQMSDLRTGGDPVRYADLRTSMCDLRASLSIAVGVPMDQVVQQLQIEARLRGVRRGQ